MPTRTCLFSRTLDGSGETWRTVVRDKPGQKMGIERDGDNGWSLKDVRPGDESCSQRHFRGLIATRQKESYPTLMVRFIRMLMKVAMKIGENRRRQKKGEDGKEGLSFPWGTYGEMPSSEHTPFLHKCKNFAIKKHLLLCGRYILGGCPVLGKLI